MRNSISVTLSKVKLPNSLACYLYHKFIISQCKTFTGVSGWKAFVQTLAPNNTTVEFNNV